MFLSDVAIAPGTRLKQVLPNYAEATALRLMMTPWVEKYGLSYKQTMDLPFSQYQMLDELMTQYLEAKKKQPPPT